MSSSRVTFVRREPSSPPPGTGRPSITTCFSVLAESTSLHLAPSWSSIIAARGSLQTVSGSTYSAEYVYITKATICP